MKPKPLPATKPALTDDQQARLFTMRLSVVEGMLALVMIGLIQNYYVPYLNAMKASKLAIGIGFGAYLLAQGMPQIWSPLALRFVKNYRNLLILGTALQALLLIPFALAVHYFPAHAVWLSIAIMFLSSTAGGIVGGAWSDLMSYIVPRRIRGKYFSFRTSMTTLSQLIASIVAAVMLDNTSNVILVFTCIWFASMIGRSLATLFFCWHYDPPEIYERVPQHTSFAGFLRQLHTHSYGRFVLAYSLLYFGSYFSAPFFALHMLNDLHFSYFKLSCIQLIMPLATVLSLRMWGRISDRLGTIMPMRLTATLILLLPVGWLVSTNFGYLLVLNSLSGVFWGGFQMLSFNYSIGELPSGQRLAYISYMNAIASIFYFAGSALGGLLGPHLPQIGHYQLYSVFVFSAFLRLPACLIFQTLPNDKPAGAKMTALEKFFFLPIRFTYSRYPR